VGGGGAGWQHKVWAGSYTMSNNTTAPPPSLPPTHTHTPFPSPHPMQAQQIIARSRNTAPSDATQAAGSPRRDDTRGCQRSAQRTRTTLHPAPRSSCRPGGPPPTAIPHKGNENIHTQCMAAHAHAHTLHAPTAGSRGVVCVCVCVAQHTCTWHATDRRRADPPPPRAHTPPQLNPPRPTP
jgi:hypothetical protein